MIIGDFELTNLLGEGAFGQVRLGTNMRTEERVAVKIMELQRIKDLGMSVNVRREISSLKKLRHPNVVKLIEVLKSSSHIYLVCELAEGGDLFDKIAEQELFDEETTRNYFRQILAGVSYCHSMGICHRDLKPENILLAADGTVRISDFGFSRACIDQHAVIQVYTRVGTPNFIAPEVLSGRGYDAFSADVWSAGAVLFVMLAGYLPFDEEDLESLYTKIRRGEFKYPRYVHPLARNLISSMLVVDPLKRNTIEGVLKDPWMTNKHLDKSRVRRTLSTKHHRGLRRPSRNVAVDARWLP
ncbi:putative serine/threonine kinase [Tribonema minus]|uniref:non-specific serine/threonine protein kinase n=2 Tax=Tribonema minus TaxID=303371 RepID=A0A835YWX4_9STRA|nr:putative serine/threonine kinase [Tribonema minus]